MVKATVLVLRITYTCFSKDCSSDEIQILAYYATSLIATQASEQPGYESRGGVGGPAGPTLAGPLFSRSLVSFPDYIGIHMLLNTHAYTTCSC